MNAAFLVTWFGRIAFLALFYAFIYRLYRSSAEQVGPPRREEAAASGALSRDGRAFALVLEHNGTGRNVWIEEADGRGRSLQAGESVPVQGRMSIGRTPGNAIRLDDPYVSGRHCLLVQEGARCTLRDLAATNGTRVDGERVLGTCELRSGSSVQVGEIRFRFEVK